jgi:uncharacterized membrane protein
MKVMKTAVTVLTLAVILLGAGCGGADVRNQTTTTTTGQELLDLKKAYDSGVITEKEYERKREEILERD